MSADSREVITYMDEVVSRALGDGSPVGPVPEPRSLSEHLATADRHKDAGVRLPGPTRFSGAKEVVLRAARIFTTEQAAFNRAVLAALLEITHAVDSVRASVDQRLARWQAGMASAELAQQDLRDRVERLDTELRETRAAIVRADERQAGVSTDIRVLRSTLQMLLSEARSRLPEPLAEAQLRAFAQAASTEMADLYAQLEERFRGTREHVQSMQRDYLDDVRGIPAGSRVLDIGCGRGEWLELLSQAGVEAYGVDMNTEFVRSNRERGLDVREEDALAHLRSLAPGTLGAVTAFHVIEHIPFETLVELVDLCLRALRPGGLVIFETPNPTNLVVASASFRLDPTHDKPLHPDLLEFLVTARGFVHAEIRFLHPSSENQIPDPGEADLDPVAREVLRRISEQLNWALFGPLDFAVLAKKANAASV